MANMQYPYYDVPPTTDVPLKYDFYRPTLSQVAVVLQNGMQPLFHEIKVDIANCPCLTREPYNLVGAGLCGKPVIVQFGFQDSNSLKLWNHWTINMNNVLSQTCRDSFIIGSSYAAKPHMPYNGNLIMNAMYRASLKDIWNESRIVFTDTYNRQRRIETVTNPEIICSYYGSFFISAGRGGNVLRVHAKGRRTGNTDIITSMQKILYDFYSPLNIALGGVLRVRKGRAACNVMSEGYSEPMTLNNFIRQYHCHQINLESDLIAVGTICNYEPRLLAIEQCYGLNLYDTDYFHSFSNYGAGGQFISDTTPDITEYEGYFNIAKQYIYTK